MMYLLHDYLYNNLEDSLSSMIVKPSGVTAGNWHEALGDAFLVKVQGMAEINDFEHLVHATSNFVDIAGELAYLPKAGFIRQEVEKTQQALVELEHKAKAVSGTSRQQINALITQSKEQLKQLSDIERIKRGILDLQGIPMEDDMMRMAKVLTHYGAGSFDVTIVPIQGTEGIAFRGILDKKLLRLQPEYLRQIYEGAVAKNWTMVGEITHVPTAPKPSQPVSDEPIPESLQSQELGLPEGLKDAMRELISKISEMEAMFHRSPSRLELRVRPLAIYQETTIAVQSQQVGV